MTVARRLGGVHLVSADACRCTAGWTSAPPSRPARSRPRCHTTASISSNPTVDFTVAAYKTADAEAARRHRSVGGVALIVGGTGLYHRVVIDDSTSLASGRRSERSSIGQPDTQALYERLESLDPTAASRIERRTAVASSGPSR